MHIALWQCNMRLLCCTSKHRAIHILCVYIYYTYMYIYGGQWACKLIYGTVTTFSQLFWKFERMMFTKVWIIIFLILSSCSFNFWDLELSTSVMVGSLLEIVDIFLKSAQYFFSFLLKIQGLLLLNVVIHIITLMWNLILNIVIHISTLIWNSITRNLLVI